MRKTFASKNESRLDRRRPIIIRNNLVWYFESLQIVRVDHASGGAGQGGLGGGQVYAISLAVILRGGGVGVDIVLTCNLIDRIL